MNRTRPRNHRKAPFVVITGATRGIGLAAAEALAGRGLAVALVSRDPQRLATARLSVERHSTASGDAPIAIEADLSTAAGCATTVDVLTALGRPIDVLYHNAGAIFPQRTLTADGIEETFALNHMAPYRLTEGLLPLLRAAGAARVVTVSSEAHRVIRSSRVARDWQGDDDWSPMQAYGRSKLANILFTRSLARRLADSAITANCFHPGVVDTGFAGGTRGFTRLLFAVAKPFMLSPERGAATGVWLATSPAVPETPGHYFRKERRVTPTGLAMDDGLAKDLEAVSRSLVDSSS